MVQRSLQRKRLFYFTDKRFYDFSGVTEYEIKRKYIDSDDLVLLISGSGEADSTIDLRAVRIKGTPIISITKQRRIHWQRSVIIIYTPQQQFSRTKQCIKGVMNP